MVFTLAIRIVKNREEAEELSQDVFVKAFKNLESFRGDSKFSTWIYKIAYYASLDIVKRNKTVIHTENIDVFNESDVGIVQDSLDNVKIKLFRSRKKLFSLLKNVIEPRTIDLI